MNKSERVTILVSKEELAALDNVAHEFRMNRSEYIRFISLAPSTATTPMGRLTRESLVEALTAMTVEAANRVPNDAED